VLRREQGGEDAADVLAEGEDQEGPVVGREGALGGGVGGEEGVDPGEEVDPDCERGLLEAGRVEPEEGGQEDVKEDRAGLRVHSWGLGGGAGDRHAAVEAVVEEGGVPLPGNQAGADGRSEVGECAELRGVGRGDHEAAQGESQVDAAAGRGGCEEVRVDAGLC
jgi:hypothetical protein